MRVKNIIASLVLATAIVATPAAAKKCKYDEDYEPVVMNEDVGVPVFAYDITDRAYEVLGEVKAGVRKATVFSKEADQTKIYKELWERGEKLCADAIINAKYGDSKVSLMSWGKTKATGTAIKFVAEDPAVIAAREAAEAAAEAAEAAEDVTEEAVEDTAEDAAEEATDAVEDTPTR